MMPIVRFREMTKEENIEIIKWAYYENNGTLSVHDYTLEYYPELKNLDNEDKKIVYKKIEEVVANNYETYKERIKSEVERYNKIWENYNDSYFNLLSNYLEIEWPNVEVIEATVGLIPVFPRYLDTFSFSVGTGLEDPKIIEVAAHETLHFLWFEKWKMIHPETPIREYDSPYITWQYSEMVTDPILNSNSFADLFKNIFTEKGYDSFYELYDGDTLVMDNLRNIYNKNISIEEKMNKGFDYINNILKGKV